MPTTKKSERRPWQPERKPQEGRKAPNDKFYQSTEWRKPRDMNIKAQPLCEECDRRGVYSLSRGGDHIVPINQGGAPLDMDNLKSICNTCHNRKSGKEAHAAR